MAHISKRRVVLALLNWDYSLACFLGSLGAANCASVAALWIWELLGLELVIRIFGLYVMAAWLTKSCGHESADGKHALRQMEG